METTLIVAIVTYLLMVAAFFQSQRRAFHIPVMAGIMLIDVLFPVYLVLNRDWYKRLIEQEEIFSFMIWMHFMLVLTLYALYVLQLLAARRLLKGDMTARKDHRSQGVGILIVRGLVVLSAALLIQPASEG